MPDSTMGKVLTLGGIAVAAYFIYDWFFTTPAAATTTTSTTPTTTTTSSTTTTAAPSTGPKLSTIFTMLQAAVIAANDSAVTNNGETITATPNVFNYYLGQVLPQPANYTGVDWPPNTTTVFGAAAENSPISITAYWSAVSAYLTQTAGMSGLGVFVGLGMLASAARRGMGMYEAVPNQYPGWPEVAGAMFPGAGRPVQ
jgi:hypothetical protein